MKFITLVVAIFVLGALIFATPKVENTENLYKGVCVVEYNAGFNSQNSVSWIEKLSDCSGRRVDITVFPEQQKKHKIVVVPTLVIFNDGVEVQRYQANIMLELEVSQEIVQEYINDITMSDF